MDFVEHVAKAQFKLFGIPIPKGHLVSIDDLSSPDGPVINSKEELTGPVAVKAQVPTGGRGKAGGIILSDNSQEAVRQLLGSRIGSHSVNQVLVEEQLTIVAELYLAIATDGLLGSPVLMFSPSGGVDVESDGDRVHHFALAIDQPPSAEGLTEFLSRSSCPEPVASVADVAAKLYQCYLACLLYTSPSPRDS